MACHHSTMRHRFHLLSSFPLLHRFDCALMACCSHSFHGFVASPSVLYIFHDCSWYFISFTACFVSSEFTCCCTTCHQQTVSLCSSLWITVRSCSYVHDIWSLVQCDVVFFVIFNILHQLASLMTSHDLP